MVHDLTPGFPGESLSATHLVKQLDFTCEMAELLHEEGLLAESDERQVGLSLVDLRRGYRIVRYCDKRQGSMLSAMCFVEALGTPPLHLKGSHGGLYQSHRVF